jgi:hypothetical protein
MQVQALEPDSARLLRFEMLAIALGWDLPCPLLVALVFEHRLAFLLVWLLLPGSVMLLHLTCYYQSGLELLNSSRR